MISRVSLAKLEEVTHLAAGVWTAPHICTQTVSVPVITWVGPVLRVFMCHLVVIHIQSSCILVSNPDAIYTVGISWGSSLN